MTTPYKFFPNQARLRPSIDFYYHSDETESIKKLIPLATIEDKAIKENIKNLATKIVKGVRKNVKYSKGVDKLMHEFSLSTEEGVALMCLAEALLRIPDQATRDKLIKDKIANGNWISHVGKNQSLFVNATAWGLVITGKFFNFEEKKLENLLSKLLIKSGEPIVRKSTEAAMKIIGKQFVSGETIDKAIENSKKKFAAGYRYSFDMLGEAALTDEDAQRYMDDYILALHTVGKQSKGLGIYHSSSVSVKLSAIHPRYQITQHHRVVNELYARLKQLCLIAKEYDIGINIDAEEADRLSISLDLMDKLLADEDFIGFDGIGFVVQAYQKRAPYVIEYLINKARENNRKIMIRLVKGAYWDSEIKRAQTDNSVSYPVYTRKVHTDVSYIAAAKILLDAQDVIYPQFATHNAQTLATIYHLAEGKTYEFQCLYGMGEPLYDQVVGEKNLNKPCRIYAPVGSYETLLAYLVRRLLENGANSSFVNQIVDDTIPLDNLIQDPVEKALATECSMYPNIPLPQNIYANNRLNSLGFEITDVKELKRLDNELNTILAANTLYEAKPILINEWTGSHSTRKIYNPALKSELVGLVYDANQEDVETALQNAILVLPEWSNTDVNKRAEILETMAKLMEKNQILLFDLAIREAGKTLTNAIAEVREAVDFCRYYAQEIRYNNSEKLGQAKGIMVAISPWNFPLAIFLGQISASLAAGNVVIAKPAEQTSLIASKAVELFLQAGLPKGALQYLPGRGETIGAALTSDKRIHGVLFTGSNEVAKSINTAIAQNEHLVTLIAETGGQNAMIVDSSALTEQVVQDVVISAFDSAGQRCSALRVLYLQEEIADKTLKMLTGAMQELQIGNPQFLHTDIGPVIDEEAQTRLLQHIETIKQAKFFYQTPIDEKIQANGIFVPPTVLEIDSITQLTSEVFGPILHVIRFAAQDLNQVYQTINSSGFGLTSGIHTRINHTVDEWIQNIHTGNLYVNRNTVGAVVGIQPFGGMGLSGTGPKAGGPLYLQKLTQTSQWILPGTNQLDTPRKKFSTEWLDYFKDEISATDLNQLKLQAQQLIEKTPIERYFYMQGITGEDNRLYFFSKQKIWISKGTLLDEVKALLAIVAVGSRAVITEENRLFQYQSFLQNQIYVALPQNLEDLNLGIILSPLTPMEKEILANKKGSILTYVDSLELAESLWPLVHEKVVSINTTASGGNASLMSENY